jgi:hypothetical protein
MSFSLQEGDFSTRPKFKLCDFSQHALLFIFFKLIYLEIKKSPDNSNSISFVSDSYLEVDVCWVSKHEPFKLSKRNNYKVSTLRFFNKHQLPFSFRKACQA